jgi:hypothetical protein
MSLETNQSRLIIGILFRVETVEGIVFNFQNFFQDNGGEFHYGADVYQFLNLEYDPPERNINLDNFENRVVLPAIPLVMSLLEAHNYFIDAIVTTIIILQGFPSVPPIMSNDKGVISSYSIQDAEKGTGGVALIIQAPDSILSNQFPNTFYFAGFSANALNLTGYLPAVPLSNNASLSG